MSTRKSLGDYWFTKELDPIKEFDKNRNCFIYGYIEKNNLKEVIKQRIHREGNPDYWETAKPIKRYNMVSEQRAQPTVKKTTYFIIAQKFDN